jgi:hypothetical protein
LEVSLSHKTEKPSQAILTLAIVIVLLTLVGTCCGACGIIMPMEPGARAASGIVAFCGAVIRFFSGLVIGGYFFVYKLKPGYALIKRDDVVTQEKWLLGRPRDEDIVRIDRTTVSLSKIELHTPDDGVINVSISATYCPDDSSSAALSLYRQTVSLRDQIQNRIRGSVNIWVRQKPFPGTARRALSMQTEMERFLLAYLTESPTSEALAVIPDRQYGYAIDDLGIRLLDINIVEMQPIRPGSGKPNWGDLDVDTFNTHAVFRQFYAHAQNLSNLRILKEALGETYPEEIQDIEDIYDHFRISMKEKRS